MRSQTGATLSDLTLSGEINARTDRVDEAVGAAFAERRVKTRIRQPFPTRARGVDSDGRPFDLNVGLENISSGGAYLRIPRALRPGDDLHLVVRFSNGYQGATAALLGRILRVEPGLDGLNGIAMLIQRYEFI